MGVTVTAPGVWKRCKGCGQPIVFFPEGYAPHFPPGAVGHSKPENAVRTSASQPSRVTCWLYQTRTCAELEALHADAELLEPPTSFEQVLG